MTNEEILKQATKIVKKCSYVPSISEYEAMHLCAVQGLKWMQKQKQAEIDAIKNHVNEDTYKLAYQDAIDKACKWLKKQESWDYYNDAPCKLMSKDKIAEFRKAMEE